MVVDPTSTLVNTEYIHQSLIGHRAHRPTLGKSEETGEPLQFLGELLWLLTERDLSWRLNLLPLACVHHFSLSADCGVNVSRTWSPVWKRRAGPQVPPAKQPQQLNPWVNPSPVALWAPEERALPRTRARPLCLRWVIEHVFSSVFLPVMYTGSHEICKILLENFLYFYTLYTFLYCGESPHRKTPWPVRGLNAVAMRWQR